MRWGEIRLDRSHNAQVCPERHDQLARQDVDGLEYNARQAHWGEMVIGEAVCWARWGSLVWTWGHDSHVLRLAYGCRAPRTAREVQRAGGERNIIDATHRMYL